MGRMKKGDLVYVPQAVMLLKYNDSGTVSRYVELESPATLLVTNWSLTKDSYEVVYRGTNWHVRANDTYPVSD